MQECSDKGNDRVFSVISAERRLSQSPSSDQCWQCSFLCYPYKYSFSTWNYWLLVLFAFKKINPKTSLKFKFHDLEQNWMSRISREFCVQFTEECSPQMLLFSVFDIILPLWLVQRGKAAMILLALTWDKLKHRIGVAAWVTPLRSPCWRRCSSRDGITVVKCVGCTYKSYSKVYWGSIAQKFVKHLGILVVLNIKECWSVELLWCTCCWNWEHAKGSKYMKYE